MTATTGDLPGTRFDELPARLKEMGVPEDSCYAIATGPQRVEFTRVGADGSLNTREGLLDLRHFYDILAFCADWQVHAVRRTDTAAIQLQPNDLPDGEDLERSYLVWGRITAIDGAWCTIGDPRIGSRTIPTPPDARLGQTAALTALERIARMDHGNAAVVGQRLTGLKAI